MKKILVLPSWYPNKQSSPGFFFKEQASFLNENGFDVKILVAEELHTKSYAYQKLKRLVRGQLKMLSKDYLLQDPEAYSFPLIIQKNWSEEKKIKRLVDRYSKAYKTFEATVWQPDLIHVQSTHKAGLAAIKISKTFKVPYVIIEHAYYKLNVFSQYKQQKLKEVLLHANKVAGVSNSNKKRIREDGIDRPIEVVWNFLDETLFQLKTKSVSHKFIITTITRPDKIKDMNTFFKALFMFLNLIENRDTVEINIVGHSSIEENNFIDLKILENLDNKKQILSLIKFHKSMARPKIANLLQRSDVFVATSITESFGIALREAMLCGTPVISTKNGGSEDSITNNTGVLVDVGDYKNIAYYLKKIMDKELIFDYSYIRNHIINQCGRKAYKQRMIEFYNL